MHQYLYHYFYILDQIEYIRLVHDYNNIHLNTVYRLHQLLEYNMDHLHLGFVRLFIKRNLNLL